MKIRTPFKFSLTRLCSFVGLTFAFLIPVFITDSYFLSVTVLAFLASILALGWNVICGYTGIFNFGYAAFFGIGAYAAVLLNYWYGVSPWLGLLIGGIVAGFIGLSIGVVCLRLKVGVRYLAIVTLGFGEIARLIVTNWLSSASELFPGGQVWGYSTFPPIKIGYLTIDFAMGATASFYYVILVLFTATIMILYIIVNSKLGLAFRSILNDEVAAQSLGINTTKYRLMSFAISSSIAGLAGSFYAFYVGVLSPEIFGITRTVEIIAMVLLGGIGTLLGPVIGSFGMVFLLESLRAFGQYRLIIYGLIIIITIVFLPQGIIKLLKRSRRS